MKLPCFPIYIDEFVLGDAGPGSPCSCHCDGGKETPATTSTSQYSRLNGNVYLLSHFHTDHMQGLTCHWRGGPLLCASVTQELVVGRFGEGMREVTFTIPMWRPVVLLETQIRSAKRETGCDTGARESSERPMPCRVEVEHFNDSENTNGRRKQVNKDTNDDDYLFVVGGEGVPHLQAEDERTQVRVTLLPAFHIPGSVMFYFETPMGNLLYTGDFKFHSAAKEWLAPYFATHAVDHVYLDDTWLHLGREAEPSLSGCKRGREEFEGRASHELVGNERECRPSALCRQDAANVGEPRRILSHLLSEEQLNDAFEAIRKRMAQRRKQRVDADDARNVITRPPAHLPFKLLVYLRNQFGKELLIQRLATALQTRILVDDDRFARLACVQAVLESEKLQTTWSHALRQSKNVEELLEDRWRRRGGEDAVFGVDLKYFVSTSQLREEHEQALESTSVRENNQGLLPISRTPPLMEVVNRGGDISPSVMKKRADEARGTPHFAVVMSGWSNVSRQPRGKNRTEEVSDTWHVPTTLHSTPQEIIDFIKLLCPISVTPFHFTARRDAVVRRRLGPYLRTPHFNDYLKLYGPLQDCLSAACWHCPFLSSTAKQRSRAAGCDNALSVPQCRLGYRFQLPTDDGLPATGEDEDDIALVFGSSPDVASVVSVCLAESEDDTPRRASVDSTVSISSTWSLSQPRTALSPAACDLDGVLNSIRFSSAPLFHFACSHSTLTFRSTIPLRV